MSQVGIVSPNLPLGNSWKSSLANAFQQLRRIPFLTEPVFQFSDFDPQIDWQGMTVATPAITFSRYLQINNFLWFSLDFEGTLAAPLTSVVYVTLPGTAPIVEQIGNAPGSQRNAATLNIGGTNEAGYCAVETGTNLLAFRRSTDINYTAVLTKFRANGFIEVM